MAEQQNQNKEPEGGLPFLEWALKHQGRFLAVCILCSLVFGFCFVWIPVLVFYFFIKPNSTSEQISALSNFTDFPVFFLAFVVASVTFAVTIWRGYQTYEQIRKTREQVDEAQKQFNQARFQNALQMATERENAGRCISGLRILEDMYESLVGADRVAIHSVAFDILALPKEGEKRISSSARQRALNILIDKKIFSQSKSKNFGHYSTMKRDFSRLNFTAKSKGKTLDLSGFSFHRCDFSGANLSDINFEGANFMWAHLYGVNVTRTNFVNAKNLPNPIDYSGDAPWSWAYCLEQPKFTLRRTISSWFDWKNHIRTHQKKPEGLEQEAWEDMLMLAFDDADYPPGVVGGDGREEEG